MLFLHGAFCFRRRTHSPQGLMGNGAQKNPSPTPGALVQWPAMTAGEGDHPRDPPRSPDSRTHPWGEGTLQVCVTQMPLRESPALLSRPHGSLWCSQTRPPRRSSLSATTPHADGDSDPASVAPARRWHSPTASPGGPPTKPPTKATVPVTRAPLPECLTAAFILLSPETEQSSLMTSAVATGMLGPRDKRFTVRSRECETASTQGHTSSFPESATAVRVWDSTGQGTRSLSPRNRAV